jgi:hypothetical protein
MPTTKLISALTAVWNNAGTTFDAIKKNVTNTASAVGSMLLRLQVDAADIFSVRKDGRVTMNWRNTPSGWGEGQYGYFEPYQFGIAYKQGGGTGATSKDNRLELYLGDSDTSPAEFSVRCNTNGTGAIIQARNGGDTDGLFLSFQDASYPFVRWGNAGPYLIKDSAGALVQRNYGTPAEAQNFWIANTFTPGGIREYLRLGWSSNRAKVSTAGVGGGTQRPLDFDASTIQFQTGGTLAIQISSTQIMQFLGSTSAFPALKRSSTTLQTRLADDSDFAPIQGKLTAHANAAAETPTATHTLRVFDAAGTEYRVLAIAV